ncbi:gmf family protein [Fusarium flagelliforme]|uniref:Gmf family protein n=1 Tax=Fusarium flagelliforme TaxID=2675880 RepID=A0A395MWC2_9HYPO|nr:gmf family protein [Fusarium flagelliforme]
MASESRLYTFSGESKDHLRKFRLTTSRAKGPQAVICMYVSFDATSPYMLDWSLTDHPLLDMIDKNTYEIRQDEDKTVYTSLDEISDDLPDHAPRFILLSYPLTMGDGRLSVPYVLIFYLPVTCNAEIRMLYAGAKELMRNTAEVGRIIDIETAEELEEIPDKLKAE